MQDPHHKTKTLSSSVLRMTSVPCELLGKLLDAGKSSAYAAHMLAIKRSKGKGFVLNEKHMAGEFGIGKRPFQAGIRLMKETGVLKRAQPNRRDYAVEALKDTGHRFVLISDEVLTLGSDAVAFILVANLSPNPQRPADIARRIGIRSAMTVRKLVKQAVAANAISASLGDKGTILVARRGFNFDLIKNDPAKNDTAKNDTAHSRCKGGTGHERFPQNQKRELWYGTRSGERAPAENVHRIGVLRDWKLSAYWSDTGFLHDSASFQPHPIKNWHFWLSAHGGAPDHLMSEHAHRQALEIAHELRARSETSMMISDIMRAIAYWTCKAHADGKQINSLGFIAEYLNRRVEFEDFGCLLHIPIVIGQAEFESAAIFAYEIIGAVKTFRNFDILDEDALTSTQQIEILASLIDQHGKSQLISAINHVTSGKIKPESGSVVIGWSWFLPFIRRAA